MPFYDPKGTHWARYTTVRPLQPSVRYTPLSCTTSVGILRLGPLSFLFFVFPSRPLPLTPPGRVLTGRSKTLAPGAGRGHSGGCAGAPARGASAAPHRVCERCVRGTDSIRSRVNWPDNWLGVGGSDRTPELRCPNEATCPSGEMTAVRSETCLISAFHGCGRNVKAHYERSGPRHGKNKARNEGCLVVLGDFALVSATTKAEKRVDLVSKNSTR